MTTYPGGKNGAGVYQKIICQMPPHDIYIEAFLGSGAIMRLKRPAITSIGIDVDAHVVNAFCSEAVPGLTIIHAEAISYLQKWRGQIGTRTLIYCDPPYLFTARKHMERIYQHELGKEEEHRSLIAVLREVSDRGALVMLSGYKSALYDELLADWRTIHYQTMTRGGRAATEYLWMNFSEPVELHDYRYLGNTFRERERIKKQQKRWRKRLSAMPRLQRLALMATLAELRDDGSLHQQE